MKVLKIASLLLFVCFVSFGQTSVPNTTTFSLQDVYNVVHGHASGTQTNLQSCFDNSVDAYFDTNYKGSKNSLYNFRNYTVAGCSVPTVTTASISNITGSTASGGGNVTSDGGCTVTARGVCWSTSQNPTTSNSHTSDGTGTGSFTSSLTGLNCNNTYYVRAYATNSQGTSYGSQVSFTPRDADPSTLTIWTRITSVTNSMGVVLSGTSLSDAQVMCAAWATKITYATTNYSIDTDATNGKLYNYPGFINGCRNYETGYYLHEVSGTIYIYNFSNGVVQSKTQCYP